ncbi:hypothetical protein TIFTF001_016640 [Ficus carica]|uniref:Uncharacterized protein n=1 Tax=Ficus carica TaxID=3494 RepID=A0AA88A6M5_FICCA|nr:hypothetical protein TIFTF001_016640 [Ficus carica]
MNYRCKAKTDAIKGFMNCRQNVGTPIKEHMMTVMAYLSEAQANGAEIDAATQLVMVLQILSKDFDLFQASYNLNQKEISPAPKPKRKKEKGKNKGNKPAVNAPAFKKSKKTKKRKVDPKKAKCFHCGKK